MSMTPRSKQNFNFGFEYLCEIEAIFENTSLGLSGALMGQFSGTKNWDVKFSIGNAGPLNTDITFNNTENNLAVIILLKETNLTER